MRINAKFASGCGLMQNSRLEAKHFNYMDKNYYKLLGIKPGQMDSNGIMYSKEALIKAIGEFVTNFKNGNKMGELVHEGTAKFDICWNQKFEDEVRKRMLEILGHDKEGI